MTATNDVVAFLKQTRIRALFEDATMDQLVSGYDKDPALMSFRKLMQHKLLSIPLFSQDSMSFVAFFDIIDVLHYITSKGMDGTMTALETNVEFAKVPSIEVANCSGKDEFVLIRWDQPLIEAMEVMVHDHPKLHRLPVMDEKGQLRGILSQSRLVRFLTKYIHQFDFATLSIHDTHLGVKDVVTVSIDDSVRKALQTIKEKKISAAAILAHDGTLIGNFSATDLKLLGYGDNLSKIAHDGRSMQDFLNAVQPPAEDMAYPVVVGENATTEEVVAKLSHAGVHRVYIVDRVGQPTGVISLVDIIELFIRHIIIE